MYNRNLETFILTADCGSFAKTAEVMHLSSTAIMKQVNQLENHLGVILFIRTNKGLILTEAGKSLYKDIQYMMAYSEEAIERAKNVVKNQEYHIRIGNSLMNSTLKVRNLLQKIAKTDPSLQFHIVPFDDYRENYSRIVNHLGAQIDVIFSIYGFSDWTCGCHKTFTLSHEPVCIAVTPLHPLADKERVKVEDLYGESLFITEQGDSNSLDIIREHITKYHPQIRLINMKYFDLTIYNHCAAMGHVLLTCPSWAYLHPMLKLIEVEWDYSVPFGIIYAQNPGPGVKRFLKNVEKMYENNIDNILLK